MKKNEVYEIEITGLTSEGSGVGRIDGIAVFVPFSAIGDRLKILILKAKKNYAYGKILEVLHPSPDRAEIDCPVFGRCGGCVYRHLSYEAELHAKQLVVQNNLQRIGGFEGFEAQNILADSDRTIGYRNKAQYPFGVIDGKPAAGFYSARSHRITPCTNCALQPKIFSEILNYTLKFIEQNNITIYDERTHTGLWRHLFIRQAQKTGEIMVMPVINGAFFPREKEYVAGLCELLGGSLKSVMLNSNTEDTNVILGNDCKLLYGQDYITDELCGVKVRISPLSFYQVNRDMAERLYLKAAEYAEPEGKTVLDLYCGAGTIGLSMAKSAKKIIGVEIIPDAVEDAKINARENGIENAEFICGDAAKAAEILAKRKIRPDVVIVDPPRKGCDERLLEIIAHEFSPERIVYVSCDSATLSRDLKHLAANGYTLTEATPCDLFPGTPHVETVALLSRQINVHSMKLNSFPFKMVKSGEKTIELRLFDEKRQQIKVGDKIVFTNTTTGEMLGTTVAKLHRFDSFNELYKSLPLLQCGYTPQNINMAHPSDMEQYYSVEEQKKYSVVGIELCRPKQITDECCALLCRTQQ